MAEGSDLNLYEVCSGCDGNGYRRPLVGALPQDADTPPMNEWCPECDRRGYVLTDNAWAILSLVQEHGDERVFGMPSALRPAAGEAKP